VKSNFEHPSRREFVLSFRTRALLNEGLGAMAASVAMLSPLVTTALLPQYFDGTYLTWKGFLLGLGGGCGVPLLMFGVVSLGGRSRKEISSRVPKTPYR
jgi:hypothetical protein